MRPVFSCFRRTVRERSMRVVKREFSHGNEVVIHDATVRRVCESAAVVGLGSGSDTDAMRR